jgi:hypothetical protein
MMRPELRRGVYCLPGPDGAHLIHNGGQLSVKGPSAATLLRRLLPHLDGRASVDELLDGLPPRQREAVRSVVVQLAEAGCVRDAADDAPHTLDRDERTAYGAEIGYVGCFQGAAAHRFQGYRESSVVLCGAGLTLTALVEAALRSGLRRVIVLITSECDTDLNWIRRCAALAGERDNRQELALLSLDDTGDASVTDAIGGADAVLHVSDRPMLDRARRLDRLCTRHGRLLVQAVVGRDSAWIGPPSGVTGPRWESAWRRLAAARPGGAGVDPFTEAADA